MEPCSDLRLGHQCVAPARSGISADGRVARAVLGNDRPRSGDLPRVLHERPRRHLRTGLSGHHDVRALDERGGAHLPGRRAVPRACPQRHAHQRHHVAHTSQRPRPAARDSRQLLSQAVSGVRRRCRGARGHSRRSRSGPISRRSSAPASKKRRRRPRWSRNGWSKTMRRCNSETPARWRRSTIRSWCSSGAPSIRT